MTPKTTLSQKERALMFLIPIIGFMLYAVHHERPEGQAALDVSASGTFIYYIIIFTILCLP